MSREIKFRALSNGKLYDCHLCNFDNMTALLTVEGSNSPVWSTVEKFIQYTGLKDKNGKDIYEGDIVKDKYGEIGTVYFNTDNVGSCGCCYESFSGSGFVSIGVSIDKDSLVIGNSFENPELSEPK